MDTIKTIKELAEIMKSSDLGYLKYKDDNFELELGHKRPVNHPPVHHAPAMPVAAMPIPSMPAAPVAETPASAPAVQGKSITSPIVGTFYAAPAPDKAPFVKVGDKINEGDVVCIVESMKVMNEILADVSGTVASIAVKDGEAVEFGQPLIIIE